MFMWSLRKAFCSAATGASRRTTSSGRPLEGVTVVALEQAVAAPLCTSKLVSDEPSIDLIDSGFTHARFREFLVDGQPQLGT
jgi:hypothetical protein